MWICAVVAPLRHWNAQTLLRKRFGLFQSNRGRSNFKHPLGESVAVICFPSLSVLLSLSIYRELRGFPCRHVKPQRRDERGDWESAFSLRLSRLCGLFRP
jgi:hypothetical protein